MATTLVEDELDSGSSIQWLSQAPVIEAIGERIDLKAGEWKCLAARALWPENAINTHATARLHALETSTVSYPSCKQVNFADQAYTDQLDRLQGEQDRPRQDQRVEG